MFYLTEKDYNRKLEKIRKNNQQIEYKEKLKKEENKYKSKNKVETSKLIMVYLIVLLNIIIAFSMISMWHFADLTYLGVLISDIAAQVIVYAIYCLKAYHGKKQAENTKFEREKFIGSFKNISTAVSEHEENTTDIVNDTGLLEINAEDYVG